MEAVNVSQPSYEGKLHKNMKLTDKINFGVMEMILCLESSLLV